MGCSLADRTSRFVDDEFSATHALNASNMLSVSHPPITALVGIMTARVDYLIGSLRKFCAGCGGEPYSQRTRYWFHGHTHDSVRVNVGSTLVLCNPFGYAPRDLNPDFNESLMVTVPATVE